MSNYAVIIVSDIFIAGIAIGGALSVGYYLLVGRALWPFLGAGSVTRGSEPIKYWVAVAWWTVCASGIAFVNGPYGLADLGRFFGRL